MKKQIIPTFPLALAITLTSAVLNLHAAAPYFTESGGVLIMEAEHFTARADNTNAADTHHWHVVPDDNRSDVWGDAPADGLVPDYVGARGTYIVSLPNVGQNKNSTAVVLTEPYTEYAFNITTAGEYALWLRWAGYDAAADSIYVTITEFQDGIGAGLVDWWRMVALTNDTSFSWQNDAAMETAGGAGSGTSATWTFAPGTYHLRIYQREDGSAVDAILLQLTSLTPPSPVAMGPTESELQGLLIGQQPQSQTVNNGAAATITVTAVGVGSPVYQWQSASPASSTFTNIASATNFSYGTGPVTPAQNGTQYRVVVTLGTNTLTSRSATLTVDAGPPVVLAAFGSADSNRVNVIFDEPVNATNAVALSNYNIAGLAISSAKLVFPNTVVLTTAPQVPGTPYVLHVEGIMDLIGNVSTGTNVPFLGATLQIGGLRVDIWTNIPGSAVMDLTSSPHFADPSDLLTSWGVFGPYDPLHISPYGDNFGAQVSGWIIPPTNGNYKFYLRSDDASQLFLSTNASAAGETEIAHINGFTTAWIDNEGVNSSAPIELIGGERYWIRALWKEGNSADYLQVAWRTPFDADLNDVTNLVAIPGSYLQSVADPSSASVAITQDPISQIVPAGTNANFSVRFTTFSAFGPNGSVQWQKASPGSATFTNIPGAVLPDLTISVPQAADSGSRYRAIISNIVTATSAPATLTVLPPGSSYLYRPVVQNGQVTISWIGPGTLEEATSITGPWDVAPSQSNPQSGPLTGTARFFRLKQ